MADERNAAKVRRAATLRLDQRPQIKDVVGALCLSAKVAKVRLEGKAEREVESDQQTLSAAEPALDPVRNFLARPMHAGGRDQPRWSPARRTDRDSNSVVTPDRSRPVNRDKRVELRNVHSMKLPFPLLERGWTRHQTFLNNSSGMTTPSALSKGCFAASS